MQPVRYGHAEGDNTADRPHRRSKLIEVPEPLEVVPIALLEALANQSGKSQTLPRNDAASKTSGGIDLRTWLDTNADKLPFTVSEKPRAEHRFFAELNPCPFYSDHEPGGAYIGQLDNGGIYARCQHARCGGAGGRNRWAEILRMVEPKERRDKKAEGDETPKRILPHFQKDGRLFLDVLDKNGHYWFAYQDDVGSLTFSQEVIDVDGAIITPCQLPIHQNSGRIVHIVGLPSKEAVEAAPQLDTDDLFLAVRKHLEQYIDVPDDGPTPDGQLCILNMFLSKRPTCSVSQTSCGYGEREDPNCECHIGSLFLSPSSGRCVIILRYHQDPREVARHTGD